MRSIKIERGLSYNAIKKNIAAKLKLQSHQTISSLTYKFLNARDSNTHTALEIVDDDDIDCMISTFEQRSPLTVHELYAKIDVVGSSFLSIAPSIHSTVAFGDCYSANVYLSDEDDDKGEIPDSDSSESEVELDSSTVTVSHVAS